MTARALVLARRAERLARRVDPSAAGATVARVVVVEAGGQRLGLPVDGLKQIVPLPPVAPVRSGRSWLRGLAQVRGELLGVVDLADLLGLPTDQPARWLAIVTARQGTFGLCIREVRGFREVRAEELAPDLLRPDRPLLGVTRDLVTLLDLARVAAMQNEDDPPSPGVNR